MTSDPFYRSSNHVIKSNMLILPWYTKLFANNVDPNQTAHEEQSDLGLFCLL